MKRTILVAPALLALPLSLVACDGQESASPEASTIPGEVAPADIEIPGPAVAIIVPTEMPTIEPPRPGTSLSVFMEGDCGPEVHPQAGGAPLLSTGGMQDIYLLADGALKKQATQEKEGFYLWGEITDIGGSWPEDGWLGVEQVERAYEHYTYVRSRNGKLGPVAGVKEDWNIEHLDRWGDSLLAYTTCDEEMDSGCKVRSSARFRVVEGDRVAPKLAGIRKQVRGSCSFLRLDDIEVVGDEIHALGRTCGWDDERPTKVFHARWDASGGLEVTTLKAAKGAEEHRWPDLALERAADGQMWASVSWDRWDKGPHQLWHHGADGWSEVEAPLKQVEDLQVSPEGEAWLLGREGELWRTEGAHWVREAEQTRVTGLGGVAEGRPLVIADAEHLFELEEGGWAPVELARPAFDAGADLHLSSVQVSGGEVWVAGSYRESQAIRGKQRYRSALLTSASVDAPLRCGTALGGGPEDAPRPWPQAADESCETPMALLSYRRSWARDDTDYPTTRAALDKGDAEAFGDYELLEFQLGDQHVLGATASSVDAARAMAEQVAGNVRGSLPEVVCLPRPEQTRPIVVASADADAPTQAG